MTRIKPRSLIQLAHHNKISSTPIRVNANSNSHCENFAFE